MSKNNPVVCASHISLPGAPSVLSDKGAENLRASIERVNSRRHVNVTSEKIAREAPQRETSLTFSFGRTNEPGVYAVTTERGTFEVRGEDRRDAYIRAAALVHRCDYPIKPETE